MRKIVTLLAALSMVLASLLAGCSPTPAATATPAPTIAATTAAATENAVATPEPTSAPVEISVFRGTELTQDFDDTMFVDFVMGKFNLSLKYDYVPSSTSTEKLNLAFATNTYPQMIDIDQLATINHLAEDGFMLPISDYIDKLPNYRNAFKDADWQVMVQTISNAKDKFFLLPQKWAEDSTGTFVWMYRVEEIRKAGLELPKTTDEFLNVMRTLKQSNPNLTLPNRWGLWNSLEGFNLAFRVQYDIWFDPDANDVVYGPATDKYRDLLKFMNTLFKEEILSKEFVTMTSEQRTAEFTKGNVYANFQFAGAEGALNEWQKSGGLPEDWAYDDNYMLLSAYPDKKPMRQHWPMYMSYGVALTDKMTEEGLDRILQYIDWSCTEEGQYFHEFGVEGTTYELSDGHPKFLTDAKAGDSYQNSLSHYGPFAYYLIQNEWWASTLYPAQTHVNQVTESVCDECDLNPLPVRLTPEEETVCADISVVLTQTRDEWTQAFVMGNKDPNDDAQWSAYIAKLNEAGLEKYLSTKKDANSRVK